MSNCQHLKGVFVNRKCNTIAKIQCDNCSVFICGEHAMQYDSSILCPKCLIDKNTNGTAVSANNSNYQTRDYLSYLHTTDHLLSSYSFFTIDEFNSFSHTKDHQEENAEDGHSFFDS